MDPDERGRDWNEDLGLEGDVGHPDGVGQSDLEEREWLVILDVAEPVPERIAHIVEVAKG